MKLQLSAAAARKNLINAIICCEQISFIFDRGNFVDEIVRQKLCLNRYVGNSGCTRFLVKTVYQGSSGNEVIRLFTTSLFLLAPPGDRRSANKLVAPRRDLRLFRHPNVYLSAICLRDARTTVS